ncbi:PA14 domain-containing protein [Metschnikowia aff. pulcherrima]|uniref:PA14 domain-containing protein n=1 Tax=Metschnikowia aff. pulcherrima TaxID=2163413 RepID=A0A4P6XPR2_9ASCO|nr:PA14 domain-containing protein [Metschnikowia aff. pulcherrima]
MYPELQQISASSEYTAMLSTYFCYFILLARLALANTPDLGVHLSKRGFNATFFKYELGSDMGWRPGYFRHISKSSLGLETVGKVVDMNFRFEPQAENPNFHNVYRSKQRVTNMGLRLTAYFRPHASGYYRFNLAANDGAQLTIGPIRWPCEHKEKIETHKLVALRALKDQSHLSVNEFDIHLIEGYYYPVEVITFNLQGDASLQLSVTDPEIINYADFGYLVHQGTFDKCGTSSKALSNSVFADANKPAEDSQTHSQAAPPPVLHEFSSVHGMGYEDSSLIKDRSGQRSFDSTDSVVNAQIGNTEHLKSEDLMVLGRPIIEAEYFNSWGFNIDEYKYSVGGKQGWEPDYFTSPRTGEKTQSLKNIDFINYDSQHPENRKYSSRYGSRPKGTGFEAEMSAHFKAPTSGTYSFELTGDDGAYMSIGLAEIPCGRRGRGFRSIFEMTALTKAPRYTAFQKTGPVTSRGLVTLLRDMYYPVKVITFNLRDSYSLRLSVTDPLGLKIHDFGNLVFQARDECGPLGKAMSNSLMGAYDTSADTQNGYTTRHSVHSENLHMPDNSTARLEVGFSTLKKNLPDTEYVIVQGGPVDNGIHVHLLNTTDKSPKEPDQLSVKLPGIIKTQESGPDPLSPSELAASGDIEDKEKPLRQFRDTTDPKKQTKPQPMLKQDESTQVSVGPQALSDFQNSTALQVLSKLVEQGAPDKNDTSSGVVDELLKAATTKKNETEPDVVGNLSKAATQKNNGTTPGVTEKSSTESTSEDPKKNQPSPAILQVSSKVKGQKDPKNNETEPGVGGKLPESATSKNNDTKPDAVEKSSTEPTSDAPKKNQLQPDVHQGSSKGKGPKDSKNNETEPGVGGKLPTSAMTKNNETKPGVVENLLEAAAPKNNETKLGGVEESSKEPKSNDSTKSQPSPAALQLSSTVKGSIVSKNNETKPGVGGNLLNAVTPKNNETKLGGVEESSKEPKSNDSTKSQPSPAALQLSSTVKGSIVSKNNETKPGVGGNLLNAVTPKNNETKLGGVEESSKEPKSNDSTKNQPSPAVLQVLSQVKDQKVSNSNKTESGVSGMLPNFTTPKKNETKPIALEESSEEPTPKKNDEKPGITEKASKEPKSNDSTKNQPSPAVLQVLSQVKDQKVSNSNKTESGVRGMLPNLTTPKKNETKPDALEESSTGPTSDDSKNNQPKPDVLLAPSTVMDKKVSKNNATKSGVLEEPSKAATSKNNDTKLGVVEKSSTVMDKKGSKSNETEAGVVEESSKEPTAHDSKHSDPNPEVAEILSKIWNDTKPAVVEKSSKEPTADVSETSDPKVEVAKDLSKVATPDISEKNDGKSSNFVNQNGPERTDPKRESSGEPPDALMKEVSNENDADSVVSEKSSKIVIPDDFVNTRVKGEILQDSSKELSPDSVTDHDSTPDVLEVPPRELEPHDQKLNELVVELNPLLREERTKNVLEPGAFEAPLVLVSGNLTAATPIVDAPADSNKSISDDVKASPPFDLGVLLRVNPVGLDLTMTPEVESADTPVIAKENISANSGSEIPAPEDFEVSASVDSAEPAFSNNSMPAQSVVQMPVPSEIIAETVPKNETSADLNEQVPANPEDPMPDSFNELMPAILPAEALAVSDAPLPIAPEDVLEDIPIEISMGIANVSAEYLSEEALSSLLYDSRAETSKGLRPAVPEVPLLAASQNLSPVFTNLENSELANETLPVLTSLENSVIANETLSVVAIDEVPETPASEAPIVSIAEMSELKSGASEDPLSLIEFSVSMSGPTRFQEANPGSVEQVLRDNNSTTTSHLDHGTQVEAFQKESELVPDELGTLEVVSDKRLQETKPSVQAQRKPHSQSDQPGLSDDAAQSNAAHGITGEVVVHIAQDAEIMAGNPGSSTLNVDSNPQKSTHDITRKNFNGNKNEPSKSKLSEAGTMAPVLACLGNNCSSEAAIDNVGAPSSIKGDGLKAASANSRIMTLVSHATSAYPSSMPSGEPIKVIMFSDGGPKKIPMLILSAIALEVMIMIL